MSFPFQIVKCLLMQIHITDVDGNYLQLETASSSHTILISTRNQKRKIVRTATNNKTVFRKVLLIKLQHDNTLCIIK